MGLEKNNNNKPTTDQHVRYSVVLSLRPPLSINISLVIQPPCSSRCLAYNAPPAHVIYLWYTPCTMTPGPMYGTTTSVPMSGHPGSPGHGFNSFCNRSLRPGNRDAPPVSNTWHCEPVVILDDVSSGVVALGVVYFSMVDRMTAVRPLPEIEESKNQIRNQLWKEKIVLKDLSIKKRSPWCLIR